MAGAKHTTLTLKQKYEMILCSENERLSVQQLMSKFGCGKTQVYDTLKKRDKIKNNWLTSTSSVNMKRKSRTKNEDLNDIVFQWFCRARANNFPISGPILQSQATKVAEQLQIADFKASNGWLISFRNRHGISFNQICGENKDVDSETVNEWMGRIAELIKDYEPKNIANCDETGLFFRALPDKTLHLKGEKCSGGKLSKERLTVLLCCFGDGAVVKPLVIGKSLNPRCFKNLDVKKLPITWRANKKAWMTSQLMEEWLLDFNKQMKLQKRKVCLFLDNAACHPHLELSNVKLIFFPPNTTSVCQPLDQGVIRCFKVFYRKLILQSLLTSLETSKSASELAKTVNVLDAIRWISAAAKTLSKSCIINCFTKAGFTLISSVEETDAENQTAEELQTVINQISNNSDTNANDYTSVDSCLETEDTGFDIEDLIQQNINDDSSEEEDPVEETELDPIKDSSEALAAIIKLKNYALRMNFSDMFNVASDLQNVAEQEMARNKFLKQKCITDFFQSPDDK